MHDQRSHGRVPDAVPFSARSAILERRLLLELVTDPPPAGDRPAALAERLHARPAAVDHAIAALEHAGLVDRSDSVVRATRAALRFDELWPIR